MTQKLERERMLDELLGLCGFSTSEIRREKPRVERTFEILGINEADVSRGIERVKKFFQVELQGVRQLLSVHILTLLDLVLAREEGKEKIIYGEWPLPVQLLAAAKLAAPNIYVGAPAQILNVNLGQIFGKIAPLIEAGEAAGQAAGQAHCALYQTQVGAISKGIIPMPDLLLAAGFYCEPPGATAQSIHEVYGVPVAYADGCVDSAWGEWPSLNTRQVEYFGSQITKCLRLEEDLIGQKISEEIQRLAIVDSGTLAYSATALIEMVAKSDPQPISQVGVAIGLWLINTPLTQEQFERANNAFVTLCQEVKEKCDKGEGIVEKGAPRVYFSIAVAVDPSIVKMVEDAGVGVPVIFWAWLPPRARYKTHYRTFGEKIAAGFLKQGPVASTSGGIEYFRDYCRELDVDGVIVCFSYSCRAYCIGSLMTRDVIKKDFGIPVMVLEGDYYDSRNYSAEQMRTRVETFAQIVKMSKERQSKST